MRVRLKFARYLGSFPRVEDPEFVVWGQDGGQTIDLLDGRVLFLFSDTLILTRREVAAIGPRFGPGPPRPKTDGQEVFLPNCAAIAPRRSYAESLAALEYLKSDGLPRPILAATPREDFQRLRFWPEHGVRLGDTVYLFYLGVRTTDLNSSWGFCGAGAGLARLSLSDFSVTRCTRRGEWRLWESGADDLHFGVCVRHDGPFVYVYFATREGLSMQAHLARVSPESIANPDAYEYLSSTAPEWSSRRDDAVSLGPCASDFTVHYNRYLEKYVMLYVDGFTRTVNLRTGDAWWGPFGSEQGLVRVPTKPSDEFVYLGFEQSLFEEQDGRKIYFSYCHPEFSLNSSVALKFA